MDHPLPPQRSGSERPAAPDLLFVLGASDPEMHAIEALLGRERVACMHASVGGKRVYPANAYKAETPPEALQTLQRGGKVYLVECIGAAPPGAQRIDHHHPGDPGYGRPPAAYWEASSIGQTVAALASAMVDDVPISPELRMTAAADHCLGAAYRGLCPGIEVDALLRWHVAARASFERRPDAAVLRDVEATQRVLRQAPRITLAQGIEAADMREHPARELLIAAAREGQCCVSAIRARDGRTKVGCLVGSPRQIGAFMETWAPANHLIDIYGDPIRGFAGAYVAPGAASR